MKKADAGAFWALNYRLSMTVIASVADALADIGLEAKPLFLLAAVDEHPHPAELAAELSMPKPTITAIVKRFEAEGILGREIDPKDLRRHRLALTAKGRKLMGRGMEILSAAFQERLDRLSAGERTQLLALLEKMS